MIKYDVLYVGVSGTQTVSTIADTSGESFTSQTSELVSSATIHSNTYLYSGTAAASEGTEVITVTWSSSAKGTISCYDTAGWGATATAAATAGSGTISKAGTNLTIAASVSTYTPAANSIEISVMGGSVCQNTASFSVTPPEEKTIQKTFTTGVDTGTSCRTSAPSGDYVYVGASGVNATVKGTTAFTNAWSVMGAQAAGSPGTNSANWGEVSAYFPGNTVQSKSLAETNTLAVITQLQNVVKGASINLGVIPQQAQIFNREGCSFGSCLTGWLSLITHYALPQANNLETDCMGVQITVNSVPTLNTGVICGAGGITTVVVYVVAACTFTQAQCWWYPSLFMGFYFAYFAALGSIFKFSQKGFVYWVFAGLTFASLVAVQIGIMTIFVPVILIVANVAYSLRLFDRIGQRLGGRNETPA